MPVIRVGDGRWPNAKANGGLGAVSDLALSRVVGCPLECHCMGDGCCSVGQTDRKAVGERE